MKFRCPSDVVAISIGFHTYEVFDGIVDVCPQCAVELARLGYQVAEEDEAWHA